MGLLDGLLGEGFDDPKSAALMALSAGLMRRDFGGGLLGANQAYADAKGAQAKQKYMDLQGQNLQSEIETRKAALKRAEDESKFSAALLNGTAGGLLGGAPQMPQGGEMPQMPGAQGGQPQAPAQGLASPGGQSFLASLNEDQVVGLMKQGKLPPGTEKLWEIAKFGSSSKQGDFQTFSNGAQRMTPMVEKGLSYGPGGVGVLPGAAESQAALTYANKSAEGRAQAETSLEKVYSPQEGREVFIPRARVLGNPPGPSQGVPPTRPSPLASQPGESDKPMIYAQALAESQNLLKNARTTDEARRAQENIDGITREMQRIGIRPQGAPMAAGPSIAETNAAAADKVNAEGVAKDVVEQRKSIMNAAFAAPTNIAKYQQIGKLLQDVDGGTLTPTGTHLASTMNSLGFKVDKNLPNKEAAMSLANEAALTLRSPAGGAGMPGAMSDQDRSFLASMTPNVAQSAQGRKQVIDAYVSVQQRNQQVADFARKYEKKYGKLDNGFFDQLQSWSNTNPLFGK